MYPFERYMKILKGYLKDALLNVTYMKRRLNSAKVIGLPKSHFIKRKKDNNKTGQLMFTYYFIDYY